MDPDFELIAQAIESLKQDTSYFKDYIFPICSAFFSALLGGFVAYFCFKAQDKIQIEKEKMNASNKWILTFKEAFSNLLTLKGNYNNQITKNPVQRISKIPINIKTIKPIVEEAYILSFLSTSELLKNTIERNWVDINRIYTLASNYNYLLEIWEKWNEKIKPFKQKIIENNSNTAQVDISPNEVLSCVTSIELVEMIDLTEQGIVLTDDLLIELHDFLVNFPMIAKSCIKNRLLKNYGSILTFRFDRNVDMLLKKSPTVDYQFLSKIMEQSPETLKNRYITPYR